MVMTPLATAAPKRVLLAAPRGYCAGVDRAVQTVERALEHYGAPVYVRKEIVHNKHVVEELSKRGAIFVEQETEVPEGEMVVFSAHGVAPAVHDNAAARRLRTIDATCPLVTKVHVSARRFAADGYTIVMIGHEGHEEVEGTTGEAPESIVLVQTVEEVDGLEVPDPELRYDTAGGTWIWSEPDWDEFWQVVRGNGPMTATRLGWRKQMWDTHSWIREAFAGIPPTAAA